MLPYDRFIFYKGDMETMTNETIENLPGVGPATADKLKEAGFDNLLIIAVASPGELSDKAEIGMNTASKIIAAARKQCDIDGFKPATEYLKKRMALKRIKTGSEELDKLLGGGVEIEALTEFFGAMGSGKTQVGFQLAVNATLPEDQGGLDAEVLFIDTENTFMADRVVQIAEAKGLDGQETLSKIHVARAFNSHHQTLLVDKAREMIKDYNIKLLIVDSLTALFRSEYVGRGNLAERQQKLNVHMHDLLKFAERYGVAVYVTNQIMDSPGIVYGNPERPIGGNIVGHNSTHRVYLRRSKDPKRIARTIDSPNLPMAEAVFTVTEKGIGD